MAAIVFLLLRLLGVIFIVFDFREILKMVTVFITAAHLRLYTKQRYNLGLLVF